jgi:hypothetical protein
MTRFISFDVHGLHAGDRNWEKRNPIFEGRKEGARGEKIMK